MFLMARHEGTFWKLDNEDYLSVGIGIWNQPGFNGKCAIECSREELALECWNQLQRCDNNLFSTMPNWNIWHSFQVNNETQLL